VISEAIAMVRTLISLDEDDKKWLDERAAAEGVAMTELIRRAVRLLRQQARRPRPGLNELLKRTSGVWRQGDGLEYQRKTRREW
jgi:hypothetical protein